MHNLPKLNLPPIEPKTQFSAGIQQIWDPIRKKYLVLTPEEWVRQHFIMLLIEHLHYPKGLFKMEASHHYHKKLKRSDIEVWNHDGAVFLLVECKAPSVRIDKATIKQAAEYNKARQASYLAITNGLKHHIWKYKKEHQEYQVLSEFPSFK